jgi:2-dehydropantoate 2-reductase
LAAPPTVTADALRTGFDLVLLSCKAYDLPDAIDSFAPAVDTQTVVLPLLNGMRHLDVLKERFGVQRLLGGQCQIAATIGEDGNIVHLNDTHLLSFGELDRSRTPRVEAIQAVFSKARFEARLSEAILQEMWEKWVFIAALAASTCLMRGAVCDIARGGNADLARQILSECAGIAEAQGFTPRPQPLAKAQAVLTDEKSPLTASMLRDIERGARTEADHIIGDLLSRRRTQSAALSLLAVACAHLKTYEQRRTRESA